MPSQGIQSQAEKNTCAATDVAEYCLFTCTQISMYSKISIFFSKEDPYTTFSIEVIGTNAYFSIRPNIIMINTFIATLSEMNSDK